MYKILEKTQFSEKVFKFRIEAPAIAKHAHAGQFLMVRANETGERVPDVYKRQQVDGSPIFEKCRYGRPASI